MAGFTVGEVLASRFELRRRLGAGGLAEVFAAHDRVSDSEVAIKILHPHVAEDRDLAERFRRELAVTRALVHPGIVRVFDLHEHEGRPFFSMELLHGRTLADRLREGRLPPDEARRITRDLTSALKVAHHGGVIHRDLKPQNVFLTDAGVVKLLDFGLARIAGQSRLTTQSAVMGTPGYVAPELFAGQRPDARADIYSLGATWFEMVTGRKPLATSDPYEMARLQRERPPSARRLVPELPIEDDASIYRMLEPDPEQRFLDTEQLLRALGGELVPLPPHTPPPITAGELDVLVHSMVRPQELLRGRSSIQLVLERLGAEASTSWRLRLAGAGQAVLVSGASRRTAEAAAAVCAEHGLPATIRDSKNRPWTEELLARHGGWLLALGCGGLGYLGAVIWDLPGRLTAGAILLGAGIGYVFSWGLRPPASAAPLTGLPAQDSSVARLAGGIARRAARLKLDRANFSDEEQKLLDHLTQAADEASELARRYSTTPAEVTTEAGELGQLDKVTNRLLEIATALDDALSVSAAGSQSRALRRLRDDVTAAEQALPELKAMGEVPPPPKAP